MPASWGRRSGAGQHHCRHLSSRVNGSTYHGTDHQLEGSFAICEKMITLPMSEREGAMTARTYHAAKKLAAGSLQSPGQRVAGAPHLWRCGAATACVVTLGFSGARLLRLLRRPWLT